MTLATLPFPHPPQIDILQTPEAKAILAGLSKAEKDAGDAVFKKELAVVLEKVVPVEPPKRPVMGGVMRKARAQLEALDAGGLITEQLEPTPDEASISLKPPHGTHGTKDIPPGTDSDADRIPDKLEGALAVAFIPYYHVSLYEHDQFARFRQQPTLEVETLCPTAPPVVHYRVTPLGTHAGLLWLQTDYLTIWNHDSGLVTSDACMALAPLFGVSLDGAKPHDIDVERSAVLLAAPLVGGRLSTVVSDYKAYDYYCAAHEGTFFDHSYYWTPAEPVLAHRHLELALSRSKHATYHFNPNGMPLFPWSLIEVLFIHFETLYRSGIISYTTYVYLVNIAYIFFFECVTERFIDQGGGYATERYGLGEVRKPLRLWVADSRVMEKLNPLLWALAG